MIINTKNILRLASTTLILFFIGGGHISEMKAQDPEFTQFYANPLYLNPALAGSKRCPRIGLNYRNQWPNLTGSFVTSSASYDQFVDGLNGGIGFYAMTDNAANTLKTTRAAFMYSYKISVSRKFSVNLAAEAAFFQKSVDINKLTFGDMIDPRRGFVYQTNDVVPGNAVSGVDFSAGILGYTEIFYFGAAAHHLTEPNESLLGNQSDQNARLPMKITGHAGAMIPLEGGSTSYNKSKTFISPNILFRQQGTFTQLNVGLYLKSGALTYGVWYRNKDAFIATIGLETDNFRLGYSYDVTLSKLGIASGGSHEVSLGIVFPCKPKKKRYRTISCPSF